MASKFGRLIEKLTDEAERRLIRFFDKRRTDLEDYIPTIIKYPVWVNDLDNPDPSLSELHVFQRLPDLHEGLPIVAITAYGSSNRRLGISQQYLGLAYNAAVLVGAASGPFDLRPATSGAQVGDVQTFKFSHNFGTCEIWFTADMFASLAAVSLSDLLVLMNAWSVDVKFEDNGQGKIKMSSKTVPNRIEILDGTANTILGFVQGQVSDTTSDVSMNRYLSSQEMTLRFDVGANARNPMLQISDLIFNYFSLFAGFDNPVPFDWKGNSADGEEFNVMFKDNLTMGAETEIPRPEGDPFNKIYFISMTIGCTMVDYVNMVSDSGPADIRALTAGMPQPS